MFPFLGSEGLVKISLGVIGGILTLALIEIITLLFLVDGCVYRIKLSGNSLYIDAYYLTRPGE